ncbi:MAG TPA: HNH endonuclease [Ktedonobacteraceae bacterium]
MHFVLSTSTLLEILAAVIVLGILFYFFTRSRGRARRSPGPRPARTSAAPAPVRTSAAPAPVKARGVPVSRGFNPFKRGLSTATSDHGLAVARMYGREQRSPQWSRVAHEHLLHEPACVVCGYKGRGLQVHHIKPFHLHPELELDPTNLITLCEINGREHHLLIGHLDDWTSYNPIVRDDTHRYHNESANQIRQNPAWLEEEAHRPKPQVEAT